MPGNPTKHRLRALKKANARKDRRLQLGEPKNQRAQERATRRRRPPRRKDWSEDNAEAGFSIEKMRKAEQGAPAARAPAPPEPPAESVGTVIEIRSGDSLVSRHGRVVRAHLAPGAGVTDGTTRSPLAVGDRVQLEPMSSDAARIVAVAPRSSLLSRDVENPGGRSGTHVRHVLAANIDQVIVVCSPAEPPFRTRLIDRYLVAASRDGLRAVIMLNKADLGIPEEVAASLLGYQRLGVSVAHTSAHSGTGIETARELLRGKISLFTGHSGVGKSSLLNALEPALALRVGDVTQRKAGQGKGRHTTSSARLVPLSQPDTFVVDTPGIRSFGIKGLAPSELAGHFPDIAALAGDCPFRDCLHRGEPTCAVGVRAREDEFLHARLQSYRGMLGELL